MFLLVFSNRLSADDFGYFGTGLAAAALLSSLLGLGYSETILRSGPNYIVKKEAKKLAVLLRTSLIHIGTVTLSATALAFAAHYIADLANFQFNSSKLTAINYVVGVILLGGLLAYGDVLAACWRAKRSNFLALAPREVVWRLVCIAIVGLVYTPTLIGAIFSIGAVLSMVLLIQAGVLSAKLPRASLLPFAKYEDYSKRFWGLAVLQKLKANIGTLVVAALLGPLEAGIFFAADRIAKLSNFGLEATNLTTSPEISRAYAEGRQQKMLTWVITASVFAFLFWLVCMMAIVAFPERILSVFDPLYAQGAGVLVIIALSYGVSSATGPNGVLLKMTGHEKQVLKINIAWSFLALALFPFGTFAGGLLGAALADALIRTGVNLHTAFVAKRLANCPFLPAVRFRQIFSKQ
ncbi:hypothetical protein K3148_05760 [Qipengyuania aurantiaca]|uniref:Polysaccharide biosynthesis protein C-terminal domain-containing protein n=1 Tax=Qipengyuania aurantiaca TaxID=2867233 RepID=A0ABX8ZPD7_9SPHN|nr:hypothetical protein [Qipengyuania aurantiaca]QZD90887.1 hypothetical protein K3148_05760 [Qipengyuania aurantiaca]